MSEKYDARNMTLDPFFLPSDKGGRFCLYHPAVGEARGAVVYVHPFAEEMNRSRRCAAQQARALADAGFAVLQIDLHGCGDSAGDFGAATWSMWVEDVMLAVRWLRARTSAPLWYWGLRAGCLVAAEAAAMDVEVANFLLWQPVVSGSQHLRQWLRVGLAADMLDGKPSRNTEDLHRQLESGIAVEVAGYLLSPELVLELEAATLSLPATVGRVVCLDLTSAPDGRTLSPVLAGSVEAWRAVGHDVHAAVVAGTQFWHAQEIVDCPALLRTTLHAMMEHST